MSNNEPVVKLRDRGLTVTVWKNTGDEDKIFYSANLSKSYKDSADEWQETSSLNADDMLRGANLLQAAYNKILELKSNS